MSTKKQPCTINGVYYESESAAARSLGIGTGKVRTRLCSSNFPEYVSEYHTKIDVVRRIQCSVAGVKYRSIGLAARELKISYGEMKNRLASFNYPDYVCAEVPKKTPKYSYTVDGRKYRTLQEIADMEGLTRERIRQKMNNPSYAGYKRIVSARDLVS